VRILIFSHSPYWTTPGLLEGPEDLQLINKAIGKTDLVDIQNILNALLQALKNGKPNGSQSFINKLSRYFINGTGVAGSLVTLIDSYNAGGTAHQFIGHVLNYIYMFDKL
jgi:hypothetical protein